MENYVIITDSSCDLSQEMVDELGVVVLPLSVTVDDKTYADYPDEHEINHKDFYDMLRNGKSGKTSAANVSDFTGIFEETVKSGKDLIYLAFSSGLSSTYSSAVIAAQQIGEKYPDRKIYVVDSLCASLGQGLFVYHAAMKRSEGMSIDELRDYMEEHKLSFCHKFTVNDLYHLKRGGRVSAATALVGTMLGIKPVLHVDNEGQLINVAKAKGRKAAIKMLLEQMAQTAIEPEKQVIFISHGDCLDDANYLAEMVKERFNPKRIYINRIGPVIGAHSGPGTLALFFVGNER